MSTKTCATCDALHYGPAPGGNGALGYQCRRRPPHIMLIPKGMDLAGNMQMSIESIFPVVNPKDVGVNWFCCDWVMAERGGMREEHERHFIGKPDSGLDS